MAEIILETKLVGDITGTFNVPSYQRGYRWGEEEVTRLLDDIHDIFDENLQTAGNYCLQPIVVRRSAEHFDLIDGQQRLTTLYLIYKYMSIVSNGWVVKEPRFSLVYETRKKSAEFLKDVDKTLRDDNIDFWFICNAYETIENWFEQFGDKKSVVVGDFNSYLTKYVKVIWYEVDESQDAISLFTRLNIGKIPLTSAELIKAMFLSRDNENQMNKERREEIALQWDSIEKELHDDRLWYFLTNSANTEYHTRIDLVLDLIAGRTDNTKEKYFTFFEFDDRRRNEELQDIWQEISHTFLILKDWYGNHELNHKIGYLIASGYKKLAAIYSASKNQTKSKFVEILDNYIRESVDISENYADLSYEKTGDYARLSRLLLLFNVESVRRNGEETEWFPFDKFKYQKNGKVVWSLEHIHAQQSQGMKNQEDWKEWLRLHVSSMQSLNGNNEELITRMKEKCGQPKLERRDFEKLQEEVIARLSVSGNVEYMHSIANLALLNFSDNAALNNSTFDVKRNEIIKMDKNGAFIPFCTKMVFLKYYTPSGENQLHFWGQSDRIAYVSAINDVLADYLNEPIFLEQPSESNEGKEMK
jgi:uncharacterized protein with ParB-like and HNH nuclease domain